MKNPLLPLARCFSSGLAGSSRWLRGGGVDEEVMWSHGAGGDDDDGVAALLKLVGLLLTAECRRQQAV